MTHENITEPAEIDFEAAASALESAMVISLTTDEELTDADIISAIQGEDGPDVDRSAEDTMGSAMVLVESAEVVPTMPTLSIRDASDIILEPVIYTRDVNVGESRNILTVKIPVQMENNVSMGHDKMNILMAGDGATPSTCCLVTGVPGAGKSTMMFQLADAIAGSGNIALYNTCEESDVQVSRVSKRLRLRNGFDISAHTSVYDLVDHACAFQKNNPGKQVFLFVDSLQTITVPNYETDENYKLILDEQGQPIKKKGRPSSGQSTQVEVAQILTKWCKQTYGICFLIGQVNKDGEFAGRQAIKHWIDAHLHLDINRDRYSADYGCRTAEMTKNRFGVAGIYFPFEIEARGIKFIEPKAKNP